MFTCGDEQLSIFMTLTDEPITLMTEVFPRQDYAAYSDESSRVVRRKVAALYDGK